MEKRKKRDSRNNGKNLSRVEIYRIWDNFSIREHSHHTVLISFIGQQYELEHSEHGRHIIIYLTLQETTNKICCSHKI